MTIYKKVLKTAFFWLLSSKLVLHVDISISKIQSFHCTYPDLLMIFVLHIAHSRSR